jgi:hypothetical protein
MDTANKTRFYAFRTDLSNVKDSAVIILLSGFLNPANNQNGAPAKLIAVLPNGKVIVSSDVTGIDENLLNNEISILTYPNPASNFTNIAYKLGKSSNVSIRVIDQLGKQLLIENKGTRAAGNYTDKLDFSKLSNGLYLIELNADGQSYQQWISKQ